MSSAVSAVTLEQPRLRDPRCVYHLRRKASGRPRILVADLNILGKRCDETKPIRIFDFLKTPRHAKNRWPSPIGTRRQAARDGVFCFPGWQSRSQSLFCRRRPDQSRNRTWRSSTIQGRDATGSHAKCGRARPLRGCPAQRTRERVCRECTRGRGRSWGLR